MYSVFLDDDIVDASDFGHITYYFNDYNEALQFRDHLRNLYGLKKVEIEDVISQTYDRAIEDFVEIFGPSED